MTENPAAKPGADVLKWALWGAAALGVAFAIYIIGQALKPAGGDPDIQHLARGQMAKLRAAPQAQPAPLHVVYDGSGKAVRIADFKGQVVVMNLWATWCAPCVLEMPTLAGLQKHYAGRPVKVVAVSMDAEKDAAKAQAFIARNAPLDFYIDRERKMPFVLVPPESGMPTTVIYGRDGLERARLSGEADWTSKDARALIDAVLAER
ncbi:MAG: TlpA disulfide reductase family protein [Phenylobacterium sp.]